MAQIKPFLDKYTSLLTSVVSKLGKKYGVSASPSIANTYESDRNKRLLVEYRGGKTLEEIGKSLGVTRSRVQQIVAKEMEKEILIEMNIKNITAEEIDLLKKAVRNEIRDISDQRKEKTHNHKYSQNSKRIHRKIVEAGGVKRYRTLTDLARGINEELNDVRMYAPDFASQLLEARKKRWSRDYLKCRECGTTTTKHHSIGLCRNCYTKSREFKIMQKKSHDRNYEKWKPNIHKYLEEYNKRPDVVERRSRYTDVKFFGGNRIKALERDGFKCRFCGISQERSLKVHGKGLFVEHLDGKSNDLDNLITSCKMCHGSHAFHPDRVRMGKKEVNHANNFTQPSLFNPKDMKISIFDKSLKQEVEGFIPSYSNAGRAFVAWYLCTIKRIPDTEVETMVTDGKSDVGIDAVNIDNDSKQIFFYQGKYSDPDSISAPVNLEEVSKTFETVRKFQNGSIDVGNQKLKMFLSNAYELVKSDPEWSVRIVLLTNKLFSEDLIKRYKADAEVDLINGVRLNEEINVYQTKEVKEKTKFDIKIIPKQFFSSKQQTGRVFVCSIKAVELAKLYREFGKELFWRNVRYGLGEKRPVNKGILETLKSKTERKKFWLYNNGVTILCDHFFLDEVHNIVTIKNFSIINGAQTTTTLASQYPTLDHDDDIQVQLRIIETSNAEEEVVTNIVKFNNKQTATISQDFISNEPLQKELFKDFQKFGYFYDFKRGLWETSSNDLKADKLRLKVADLAYVVLAFHGKPGEARNDKRKYFDKAPEGHYDFIFDREKTIEEYLFLIKLLNLSKQKIKDLKAENPEYSYCTPFLLAVMGSIYRSHLLDKISYKQIIDLEDKIQNEFFKQLTIAAADTMKDLVKDVVKENAKLNLDNLTKGKRINEIANRADEELSDRDREAFKDFFKKNKLHR